MIKKFKINLLWVYATLLLVPNVALADGISLPIITGLGVIFIIPITLLLAFIESFIISKYLKIKNIFFHFSIIANIISTFSGIPAGIISAMVFTPSGSDDFNIVFKHFFYQSILSYFIFFILTLVVEYLLLLKFKKDKNISSSKKKLFYATLIANIITYFILCPLHYQITKPQYNIKTFSTNTNWSTGTSTIIYVDNNNKYLKKIQVNGQNEEILVPFSVKEYSYDKNLNNFLVYDENNNLYYFNKPNNKKILIDEKNCFNLTTVALNMSNDKIAYLSSNSNLSITKTNNPNNIHSPDLNIYDLKTKKNTKINIELPEIKVYDEIFPVVAWTSERSINIQTRQDRWQAIDKSLFRKFLKDNLKITLNNKVATVSASAIIELPSRPGILNSSRKYHYYNYEDKFGNKEAKSSADCIVDYIVINQNNQNIIHFANNPGLFHFSKDCFWNPRFVNNGKELIFNSHKAVYLINIENKKMGKIINGTYSDLLK